MFLNMSLNCSAMQLKETVLAWYIPACYVSICFFPVRNTPEWYFLCSLFPRMLHPWKNHDDCSIPFRDLYLPLRFIPKWKGCVFKLVFPDFCYKKNHQKYFGDLKKSPLYGQSYPTELQQPMGVKGIFPNLTLSWILSVTFNRTLPTNGQVGRQS